MSLFIGRLDYGTSNDELESAFRQFGEIEKCVIITGRGYGFIQFRDKRSAEDAIHDMDSSTLHGARITVQWAHGRGPSSGHRGPASSVKCYTCGYEGGVAHAGPGPRHTRGHPAAPGLVPAPAHVLAPAPAPLSARATARTHAPIPIPALAPHHAHGPALSPQHTPSPNPGPGPGPGAATTPARPRSPTHPPVGKRTNHQQKHAPLITTRAPANNK
ncbi:hypothetical protein Pelo_10504 [Pelomyxa schiedti]|nr:hypothetical protein Pelo_10504 [Pelomyxa schiedti]